MVIVADRTKISKLLYIQGCIVKYDTIIFKLGNSWSKSFSL